MTKISRIRKHFVILPLCALFFFIEAFTIQAATYYVATTGLDSNPGTSGSPFLTIQKCIDVVRAGDTCTVADGTYTDTDGDGIVGYIRSPSAHGTVSAPITVKSTNPLGAHVTIPSINAHNAGFRIARNYWIVQGFDISGGTSTGTNASHNGISTADGTGAVIRKNAIHNVASTVCSNSVFGYTGVFTEGVTNLIIENNVFYTIGRLRNGERGCSMSLAGEGDHGIYVKGTTNTTIRRNVFYDTNRGWPIHIYGGTTTNISIYNNTMAGKSPTGSPDGHIMLASTILTAKIQNNISYNANGGMIQYHSLTASGVTVSYNLSNTLEKTGTRTGVTFSNNLQNMSPGFVNAEENDFHLNPDSAAINAGTNIGPQVNDAAPDIGAYELSGQVEDTNPPITPTGLSIR